MALVPPAGVTASQFTLRWFDSLPEFIKEADAEHGWALLRFMSLLGDQADELEALAERIDFTPLDEGGEPGDTSDLVNPDTADAAWLPWLAQTVGASITGLTVPDARAAISAASGGWRAGSKGAMRDLVAATLTGTKYAAIIDHSTDTSNVGEGGEWDVRVVTRDSQTPSVPAVMAAAERAKPAGVVLYYRHFVASVGALMAAYPTVGHYAGLTVGQVNETGAP